MSCVETNMRLELVGSRGKLCACREARAIHVHEHGHMHDSAVASQCITSTDLAAEASGLIASERWSCWLGSSRNIVCSGPSTFVDRSSDPLPPSSTPDLFPLPLPLPFLLGFPDAWTPDEKPFTSSPAGDIMTWSRLLLFRPRRLQLKGEGGDVGDTTDVALG